MNRSFRKVLPILALLGLLLASPARTTRAQAPTTPDATHISVLVELSSPSTSEVYIAQMAQASAQPGEVVSATVQAAATAAAQAQLAAINAEQVTLAAALQAIGVHELYRVQRVYNAIAVRATADQVEALAALPGVRAVTPIITKMPDNSVGVPLIGAPALWEGALSAPLTGAGVRIGIIDTGIDYIHTDFGGTGLEKEYIANNPMRIDDITAFPSAKVVGGYDIVGDFYAAGASNEEAVAVSPDPDPFDCYGHGTHVAGTAAGYGVTETGKTFSGPYNSATPFAKLRIGPGVAPAANLYAIKVFGCFGGTDFVDKGIEWAVDPNGDGDFSDHLDVINLSLGSPFGDSNDSSSVAIDRAAQLGIIAVISAGNNGDVHYVTGSPGSSTYAITVAATGDGGNPPGAYTSTPIDAVTEFSSRGPRRDSMLKPDIAAPGDDIVSASNNTGNGAWRASGTSMAAPHIAGAMALLRQLHPTWRVEELKALLMNTAMADVRLLQYVDDVQAAPTRTGAGRVELQSAAQSSVIAYNADLPGSVSLSFGVPDVLVSHTAVRNVRLRNSGATAQTYDLAYVPTNDMPGVDVIAPAQITVPANGMAVAPVRLEATAALMQNTPPSLKSVDRSPLDAWQSEETGLLWMWPSPATFTTQQTGGADVALAGDFTLDIDSRTMAFSIAPVTASPNVTLTYSLQRGTAAELTPSSAVTLYTHKAGSPLEPVISGNVVLSPRDLALLAGKGLSLRVEAAAPASVLKITPIHATVPVLKLPVYAAPRPVADMHVAQAALDFGTVSAGATTMKLLPLAGATLDFSATPTTTRPLLAVFELHAVDPRQQDSVLQDNVPSIDVQYVGVTSDYLTVANKEDARIFFAVATYGPWSTPNEVRFNFRISTSVTSAPYMIVANSTDGFMTSLGARSDAFIAATSTGYYFSNSGDPLNVYRPADVQTAVFNNNVMVFSVPAKEIGLSAANPAFAFSLDSESRTGDWRNMGDYVGRMTYNMAKPGLSLMNGQAGAPLFTDSPATQLQVGLNLVPYATSGAQGILLLHLHNGSETRAEAVTVNYHWPTEIRLPIMRQTGP